MKILLCGSVLFTMGIGVLIFGRTYTTLKYLGAGLHVLGVVCYLLLDLNWTSKEDAVYSFSTGVFLVLTSTLFEAFARHIQ